MCMADAKHTKKRLPVKNCILNEAHKNLIPTLIFSESDVQYVFSWRSSRYKITSEGSTFIDGQV